MIKNDVESEKADKYSYYQNPNKVIFLSIITFGFYDFYWLYKNWKQLNKSKQTYYSAEIMAILSLIPIIQMIFIYMQFKIINKVAENHGFKKFSPFLRTVFYWYLGFLSYKIIINLTEKEIYQNHPGIMILALIGVLFVKASRLSKNQEILNEYWKLKQELITTNSFNLTEKILIILFILFWLCFSLISYLEIPKNKSEFILKEDFNNNENNWEDDMAKISGSQLIVNAPKNEVDNAYMQWMELDLDNINQEKNFIIETKLKQLSGENNPFGLAWGGESGEVHLDFVIDSEKSFSIYQLTKNDKVTIKEWSYSKFINEKGKDNLLRVEKNGDKALYYINDHLVYEGKYIKFTGNLFGYQVFNNMKVSVDFLIIKEIKTSR